jgi:hypothetical protein
LPECGVLALKTNRLGIGSSAGYILSTPAGRAQAVSDIQAAQNVEAQTFAQTSQNQPIASSIGQSLQGQISAISDQISNRQFAQAAEPGAISPDRACLCQCWTKRERPDQRTERPQSRTTTGDHHLGARRFDPGSQFGCRQPDDGINRLDHLHQGLIHNFDGGTRRRVTPACGDAVSASKPRAENGLHRRSL